MRSIDFEHVYDSVIIGGGPAGISCALECHESGLDIVVLEREERLGGQLPLIPGPIFNYAAGYFESGESARCNLEKVANLFLEQRVLTKCNVQKVDCLKKEITTNFGVLKTKTIFLGTGYRLKPWDFPVPEKFEGDILYRSGIHREDLKGKPIAIVGGGDSAVFTALDLAEYDCSIDVFVRSNVLRARPDIVARMNSCRNVSVHTGAVVRELVGGEHLDGLVADSAEGEVKVSCRKVIAKLGYLPNTELFIDQLSNTNGHIDIDQSQATSAVGVFAGGDIVHPGYDRIAYAAGSGMLAARGIRSYLGQTP